MGALRRVCCCLAQVCLASVAPSDHASFGHRSGHRSETPSPLSFTRPKAAGEGRSMSCPTLGHRSGWGPHRFWCPPHPFGVSGPFHINLLALNSDGGSARFPGLLSHIELWCACAGTAGGAPLWNKDSWWFNKLCWLYTSIAHSTRSWHSWKRFCGISADFGGVSTSWIPRFLGVVTSTFKLSCRTWWKSGNFPVVFMHKWFKNKALAVVYECSIHKIRSNPFSAWNMSHSCPARRLSQIHKKPGWACLYHGKRRDSTFCFDKKGKGNINIARKSRPHWIITYQSTSTALVQSSRWVSPFGFGGRHNCLFARSRRVVKMPGCTSCISALIWATSFSNTVTRLACVAALFQSDKISTAMVSETTCKTLSAWGVNLKSLPPSTELCITSRTNRAKATFGMAHCSWSIRACSLRISLSTWREYCIPRRELCRWVSCGFHCRKINKREPSQGKKNALVKKMPFQCMWKTQRWPARREWGDYVKRHDPDACKAPTIGPNYRRSIFILWHDICTTWVWSHEKASDLEQKQL